MKHRFISCENISISHVALHYSDKNIMLCHKCFLWGLDHHALILRLICLQWKSLSYVGMAWLIKLTVTQSFTQGNVKESKWNNLTSSICDIDSFVFFKHRRRWQIVVKTTWNNIHDSYNSLTSGWNQIWIMQGGTKNLICDLWYYWLILVFDYGKIIGNIVISVTKNLNL